jgi:hypothetical protein
MQEIRDAQFLGELYRMVGRSGKDPVDLPIYVTPYRGSSGVAGVVLTVFGTPPRATLLVPLEGSSRSYSGWGSPKAIEAGTVDYDAVNGFLERHGLVRQGKYVGIKYVAAA